LGYEFALLVGGSVFVVAKNYVQDAAEGGFLNQVRNEWDDWLFIKKGFDAYWQ